MTHRPVSQLRWILPIAFALAQVAGGCASDDPAPADPTPGADGWSQSWENDSTVGGGPVGPGPADTATGPQDTGGATAPDLVQQDTPDLVPDLEPPEVVSINPPDGTMGVVVPPEVIITFNEPLAPNTVAPQTFELQDPNGDAIDIERTLDNTGTIVTLKAKDAAQVWHKSSPYAVVVGKVTHILSDLAGNKMQEPQRFTFYTEGYPNTAVYEQLAGKYAPRIVVGIDAGKVQARIPTRFDLDGDWDGSNNSTYIKSEATQVIPSVYYDVLETTTHYYIHYGYLFPWLDHDVAGYDHANGMSGLMVVVEKATAEQGERPIAVVTYTKEKSLEENRTFGTSESGLIAGAIDLEGTTESLGWDSLLDMEAVYSQADLFPDNRFASYIADGTYQSCAWLHEPGVGGLDGHCQMNAGVKANLGTLELAYLGGIPTPLNKVDGKWPTGLDADGNPLEPFGYALVSLPDELWPLRLMVQEDQLFGGTFSYDPDDGRPGDGLVLPSSFVDPIDPNDNALGRPPWAWDHDAAGPVSPVKKGWLGLDPAWYLWRRHMPYNTDKQPFNETTQVGLGVDYCFNPYLGIDVRTTEPLCQ